MDRDAEHQQAPQREQVISFDFPATAPIGRDADWAVAVIVGGGMAVFSYGNPGTALGAQEHSSASICPVLRHVPQESCNDC